MGSKSEYLNLELPVDNDYIPNPGPYPNTNPPGTLPGITENFKKLQGYVSIPIVTGTSLPAHGSSYKSGEMIYMSDATQQSVYIMVTNSTVWGQWWRPLQQSISPWRDVPNTALRGLADWVFIPGQEPQIAYDNRGKIYFRGGVRKTPVLDNAVSIEPFHDLAKGMRPSSRGMFTIATNPTPALTPSTYQGGRAFISDSKDTTGPGRISLRFWGVGVPPAANVSTDAYLDSVSYSVAETGFFGP